MDGPLGVELYCNECGAVGFGFASLVPCMHDYDAYSVMMTGLGDDMPFGVNDDPVSVVHRLGEDQLYLTYCDGSVLYQVRLPKNYYPIPINDESVNWDLTLGVGVPRRLPPSALR